MKLSVKRIAATTLIAALALGACGKKQPPAGAEPAKNAPREPPPRMIAQTMAQMPNAACAPYERAPDADNAFKWIALG